MNKYVRKDGSKENIKKYLGKGKGHMFGKKE